MNINLSVNGPEFSRIVAGVMSWGVWGSQLDTAGIEKMIKGCLELGISTFDHADIYGHYTNEAEFGGVLKNEASLREQMQLVSKCGIKLVTPNRPEHKIKSYDTSKAHIIQSVENSLNNLNTDRLDLLLIHRPSPLMNYHEMAEAFEDLQQAGKVLHFGVSNFSAKQFETLDSLFSLVTNQIEASILKLDPFLDNTLDACLRSQCKPMAWSPLGGGKLFGDFKDERIANVKSKATELAQKYNASEDQIYLAWLMQHPSGILPVLGTTKIERISKAVNALEIQMSREDWFVLWEASMGEEVP